jgi:hypothetical protein
MRWVRRIGFTVLVFACAGACVYVLGAAAAPQRCSIQLRVNIWGSGPSPGPSTKWALQGGLNAGMQATLRAVARGCDQGIDRIVGRWLSSGPPTFITPTQCSGANTCFLRIVVRTQRAIDFQAIGGNGGATARSNIVRVAWAGGCTAIGAWEHQTDGIGSTRWTIAAGGQATEAGLGNATGAAVLTGHVLRIDFVASDQVTTGVYSWTLTPNCRSGTGTLRFTGPPARAGQTHKSTVKKLPGG